MFTPFPSLTCPPFLFLSPLTPFTLFCFSVEIILGAFGASLLPTERQLGFYTGPPEEDEAEPAGDDDDDDSGQPDTARIARQVGYASHWYWSSQHHMSETRSRFYIGRPTNATLAKVYW